MADRSGIREALAGILKAVSDSPQLLTDRVKQALSGLLQRVKSVIGGETLTTEPTIAPVEAAPPPPPTVPPPRPRAPLIPTLTPDMQETIGMLWQLSGGNPGVFQSYLNTFPDAQLQAVASTPEGIGTIANFVMGNPISPPGGGEIPPGQIPSSNVFATDYDPQTQQMLVKFNGKDTRDAGPSYLYAGVDPQTAEMIRTGAIPAKTTGSNRWGSWWKNKSPSVGSSANQLLKNGPFPYQRIAG